MATNQLAVLFQELEQAKINKQHMKVIVACLLGCSLEFFDFYIVAFVLAFIVTPWKLTFGQSSVVLWSAGFGTIIGAYLFGSIADHIGRRPTMIATVLTFSLPTGFLYFTPEGGWVYLSVFRFLVGLGVGGLVVVDIPLVQEFVPSRLRGTIGGIVLSSATIGILLASSVAGYLTPLVGWRGLFIIGLAPALFTLVIRFWIPESPRWLISKGRYIEAEEKISWILGYKPKSGKVGTLDGPAPSRPLHESNLGVLSPSPKVRWMDIFKYRRSFIVSWLIQFGGQTCLYGFTLWGATILSLLLGIKPVEAAKLWIFVALGGLVGRFFFSFMSDWIGRRWAGFLLGIGGGSLLIIAANTHRIFWGPYSLLWIIMIVIAFFIDGGFAIIGPYISEVWPKQLRASGMGSAYGFGGVGKIIGPMILALFAGTSNIVTPRATVDAVIPGFIFFGVIAFGVAVTFLFGWETKNKTFEEIEVMVTGNK